MARMFLAARAFNKPLGDWKLSNWTGKNSMFVSARAFNQPMGDWKSFSHQPAFQKKKGWPFHGAVSFDVDNFTKKTNWSRRKNAVIALNDIPIHDVFSIPEMKRMIICCL